MTCAAWPSAKRSRRTSLAFGRGRRSAAASAAAAPPIARLHEFVAEQGYELCGRHHEIYLGDPRRTAPERLKTVLRHPVRRA